MALCLSATMDWTACPPCCKPVARSSHFAGGKPCFSMRYAALLVSSTIGMKEEHYLLSLDMKWLLVKLTVVAMAVTALSAMIVH